MSFLILKLCVCLLFVLHLWDKKPFEIFKTHIEFRTLYLADFTSNVKEKNIIILIGLEYYFSFTKGNFIRSANDNLVALKSEYSHLSCRLFFTRT